MGDDNFLDQNEIERLLGGGAKPTPPPVPAPEPAAPEPAASGFPAFLDQSELDALMRSVPAAAPKPARAAPVTPPVPAAVSPTAPPSFAAPPFTPPPFSSPFAAPAAPTPISPPPASRPFSVPVAAHAEVAGDEEGIPRGDLNYLYNRATAAISSIASAKLDLPAEVIEFQFPEFGGSTPSTDHSTLDQISEVGLDVKIELGRSQMYLEDVLRLRRGSVVALDKMAGEAVDIYVNGRLLARGEVLVMNENFCVRVAELLAGAIPME